MLSPVRGWTYKAAHAKRADVDPVNNPYAPGAGTPPPELAGRDELRQTIRIAVQRVRAGRPTKSILMVGA
jgi:hypothetical protein